MQSTWKSDKSHARGLDGGRRTINPSATIANSAFTEIDLQRQRTGSTYVRPCDKMSSHHQHLSSAYAALPTSEGMQFGAAEMGRNTFPGSLAKASFHFTRRDFVSALFQPPTLPISRI